MVEMRKRHCFRSERLKAAQVDGIVLDVRDDGGLSTVVDIADCSSSKVPLFKSNQQEERKKFYSIEIKDRMGWSIWSIVSLLQLQKF
jgi:C-terminal processing protease CtpA/Prc